MDHGKLLAIDTPDVLTRSLPGRATLELTAAPVAGDLDAVVAQLARLEGVERVEEVPASAPGANGGGSGSLRVRLYLSADPPALVAPAAAVLATHGMGLADVKIGAPSLEDVFIHLTGRALR
jgi:ABC-2 type transport system ATP-binding protein